MITLKRLEDVDYNKLSDSARMVLEQTDYRSACELVQEFNDYESLSDYLETVYQDFFENDHVKFID